MPRLSVRPQLLALLTLLAAAAPLRAAACPRVSMAYYTSWSRYSYPSSGIPYDKLTHICHAFLQENSDGSITPAVDLLDANLIAQAHAHGVKVLISVGGASWSAAFPALAASAANRANFANQMEAFCRTNGYDGVDIDWEFPDDNTKASNFDALIQDLRNKFNSSPAPAPSWLITSAVSGDLYYAGFLHLGTLKNSMSFFNVMTYDYHGPWTNHSGHNAGLYPSSMEWAGHGSADQRDSINYFLGQGVPAGQLNMGLPFYGYRFPTANIYGGCSCGSTTSLAYSAIAPMVGAGWTYHFDSSAQSPYLTSGSETISYDDANSIGIKADWALNTAGLAGVFMWALDNDNLGGGNQPLLAAMAAKAFACATPTFTVSPTQVVSATPTMTPVVSDTWRINAGGAAYTDSLGKLWAADNSYSSGTAASTTQTVGGPDPTLFRSERYGAAFNYSFNVPPGSYQVTLRFAEIYYTTAGKRLFNVAINGTTVLTAFDIVAAAGGAFLPVDRVFDNLAPNGGKITISFSTGGADLPKVSALQIIPEPIPTATATPSRTASPAPSGSPSATLTLSPAPSATGSATRSATATPSATRSASPTPSSAPSSAASATVTPSRTVSGTPSVPASSTATPSSTVAWPSATATPSSTASQTNAETASSTASPSAQPSSSATPSRTPRSFPSLTGTQTTTVTQVPFTATATVTPSPVVETRTSSPSVTPTPSATRSPVATASTTLTPSPSAVATATRTAVSPPSDGSLRILDRRLWPMPGPRFLSIDLSRSATRIRLRCWSTAFGLISMQELGGAPAGWSRFNLPESLQRSLPTGLSFYEVEAWDGAAKADPLPPERLLVLR
jgi:chitinase